MAPQSSIQFIEAALWCKGPFELSYTDPDQKWDIRKDMLSLLQDFPNLRPSMDTYIHNDGTIANLLNAYGTIHVSNSSPQVPLTIWLHENYPYAAPIVFVGLPGVVPSPAIHRDHPFVDPSGLTATPYIQTWQFPRCNLKDLVHNVAKLFSLDHPFSCSPMSSPSTHPSDASKKEALDRLAGMLHYDTMALRSEADEEIEELLALQREMDRRVAIVTGIVQGLERERRELRDRAGRLAEEADVLINWLKVHDPKRAAATGDEGIDDVFEGADEESKSTLHCLAADKCIEDTIYALDEAVAEGVVNVEAYVRQVRNLAREQFHHRAVVVNFETSQQL
ncbi:protein ELC-like [Rhodamnia argentea]|uniref:Protein ELC-like n=1 Tax=Rhodamnia argentea TaxID=178133 RepID=A0A8B8QPU7_9MYRT|nr:protein ELC-like [Rhodamnia argentea]